MYGQIFIHVFQTKLMSCIVNSNTCNKMRLKSIFNKTDDNQRLRMTIGYLKILK